GGEGKRKKAKGKGKTRHYRLTFAFILFPFSFPAGGILSVALSRPLAARAGEHGTVTGGGRYPPPRPVEPGLSSPAGATVRPTDRPMTPSYRTLTSIRRGGFRRLTLSAYRGRIYHSEALPRLSLKQ